MILQTVYLWNTCLKQYFAQNGTNSRTRSGLHEYYSSVSIIICISINISFALWYFHRMLLNVANVRIIWSKLELLEQCELKSYNIIYIYKWEWFHRIHKQHLYSLSIRHEIINYFDSHTSTSYFDHQKNNLQVLLLIWHSLIWRSHEPAHLFCRPNKNS